MDSLLVIWGLVGSLIGIVLGHIAFGLFLSYQDRKQASRAKTKKTNKEADIEKHNSTPDTRKTEKNRSFILNVFDDPKAGCKQEPDRLLRVMRETFVEMQKKELNSHDKTG